MGSWRGWRDFWVVFKEILSSSGFRTCSSREGESVAMVYYAEGYRTFILKYTVTEDNPDAMIEDPMNDVYEAMNLSV